MWCQSRESNDIAKHSLRGLPNARASPDAGLQSKGDHSERPCSGQASIHQKRPVILAVCLVGKWRKCSPPKSRGSEGVDGPPAAIQTPAIYGRFTRPAGSTWEPSGIFGRLRLLAYETRLRSLGVAEVGHWVRGSFTFRAQLSRHSGPAQLLTV